MKKLLTLAVVATLVLFTSCSKENKLNKRLDGTWTATSLGYNGVTTPVVAPESYELTFNKDKKGVGTYTMVYSDGEYTSSQAGSYTLTEDTKLTLTPAGLTASDYTVTDYSKTELTITSTGTSAFVYVFKKK